MTIAGAKLTIDRAQGGCCEKNLSAVENAVAKCFASEGYAEGRRAFSENRIPKIRGI